MDNKYWLPENYRHAVNGYENILDTPHMKPDICYHLSKLMTDNGLPYGVMNCAVEESTLGGRKKSLLPQDVFIASKLKKNDIVIVSVGGNDIALSPTISTIWNMALLVYLNSVETISKGPDHAWGMNHFVDMFTKDLKDYLLRLISKTKPKKIIVCMIYFPDKKSTGGWADKTLGYLGYNTDPRPLEEAIRQIFAHAISKIHIDGTEVVPCPMYETMDGTDTNDYVQRVEPSDQGGSKLAKTFFKLCRQ